MSLAPTPRVAVPFRAAGILLCFLAFLFWGLGGGGVEVRAQEPQAEISSDEEPATLSGFVTDAADDQPLAGAHFALVHLADSTVQRGAATDRDGVFLLTDLSPGRYQMHVSFVGYETYTDTLALAAGERHTANVTLVRGEAALEEVVVEEEQQGATDLVAGQQTIQPAEVERIPTPDVGGDLTSYLTTLPSVVTTADRGGQLFIRGGEPSQNLVLLDGMVLYQPFHLLGFYSAFPNGIISHTDLHAGGFGAKYGGRLSSVLDVDTRTGNKQQLSGRLSLSPFMGEARLEGPLVPGRVSLLGSVRRSLLQESAGPLLGEELPFVFGDAFGKVHAAPTESGRLSVSAIHTYDRGTLNPGEGSAEDESEGQGTVGEDARPEDFTREPLQEVRWQNWGVGARYLSTPQRVPVIADLQLAVSGLRTELGPRAAPTRASRIRTTRLVLDATFPGDEVAVRAGLQGNFSRFYNELGGLYQNLDTQGGTTLTHIATYLEPEWNVGAGLQVRPGLRLQFLQSRFHPYVVPRLRVIWEQGPHRISAGTGRYYQEILALSDRRDAASVFSAWTNVPKASDLPAGDARQGRTPRALHGVLGYRARLGSGIELSVESFYKRLSDLFIAEWTAFPRFTTRLQPADGRSFGAELRVELRRGPFYGYLGYGYSNTVYAAQQAQIELWYGTEELRFRPPHDRRHQVSLVASMELADFDVSLRWQFGSGRPYSRVVGFDGFALLDDIVDAHEVAGSRRVIYTRPYDDVLPRYHRLDVSVERAFSVGNDVELVAQGSAINAYDRRNVFYIDTFTQERVDQLPITPSVGLSLRYR